MSERGCDGYTDEQLLRPGVVVEHVNEWKQRHTLRLLATYANEEEMRVHGTSLFKGSGLAHFRWSAREFLSWCRRRGARVVEEGDDG